MAHQGKILQTPEGIVVESGGSIEAKSGATITVNAGANVTGLAKTTTALADLGGTLTGAVDGDLADVADIALDTSNTYTDAAVNGAVNTAIASVNLQLKELQAKLNAALAKLRTSGVIAAE